MQTFRWMFFGTEIASFQNDWNLNAVGSEVGNHWCHEYLFEKKSIHRDHEMTPFSWGANNANVW